MMYLCESAMTWPDVAVLAIIFAPFVIVILAAIWFAR